MCLLCLSVHACGMGDLDIFHATVVVLNEIQCKLEFRAHVNSVAFSVTSEKLLPEVEQSF